MQQRSFAPRAESAHHRPRLLIEDPSVLLDVSGFRRFEEAGFDVALCSGPDEIDRCPLAQGAGCHLIDLADVVMMGPGMAAHRAEMAAAIQHRRPGLPIVVQVTRSDAGTCPPGCVPSFYPVSVDGQIRSLWRALHRRTVPHPSTAPRPAAPASNPAAPNR